MEACIVVDVKNGKAEPHHLVSKRNELIEAKYRLTLQEQRLIALMAAEIKPDQADFHPYRFRIRDFAELLEIEGKDYYTKLKAVTRKLITRSITIREGNKLIQLAWLSSATYHEREGWVELRFDPALKPYLLQLKECFAQYQLDKVLQLRSKYAFRLYELMKKNELLGKVKYQLSELRELLGVEKGELVKWVDFRRWCLDVAVKEVNAKTDLKVSYEPIKWGRRYTEIVFKIRHKPEQQSLKLEDDLKAPFERVLGLVPEEHRWKRTIRAEIARALKRHGEEYCVRNVLFANEKAERNYRAFLIQALKKDWGAGWWEDKQAELEAQRKEEEKKRREEEEEKRILELKRRADEYLARLTDLEREALLEEARKDEDLRRIADLAPNLAIRQLVERRILEGSIQAGD